MNRLRKICLAIAAPLFCVSGIFAQEKNPADTTAVTTPAAPQDAASDDTEETLPPFDEKAPIMKGKPKRYFIRKINLRGIEYLNKTSYKPLRDSCRAIRSICRARTSRT